MVSRTLILDHLNVVVNVHTGAGRNELTDNNIFLKTHELIGLASDSCVCKSLSCLLATGMNPSSLKPL